MYYKIQFLLLFTCIISLSVSSAHQLSTLDAESIWQQPETLKDFVFLWKPCKANRVSFRWLILVSTLHYTPEYVFTCVFVHPSTLQLSMYVPHQGWMTEWPTWFQTTKTGTGSIQFNKEKTTVSKKSRRGIKLFTIATSFFPSSYNSWFEQILFANNR